MLYANDTPAGAAQDSPVQAIGGATVHEALRAEPGLVLNSQGASQDDLSIRGSSYSGTGLSLGELTLRSPQTGHFNTELPLPAAILTRPSVRIGLDNQGGHLSSTTEFDLLPLIEKRQIDVGIGSSQRNGQSALVQHLLSRKLGLGLFAGRDSAAGVDYPDNDFDRTSVGGQLQFLDSDTQVDLLIAHQKKEFGARGYYGVSDTVPANETTRDTLLYLAARKGSLSTDYLRTGAAWRQFRDEYEVPALNYFSRRSSHVSSAFFDGRTLEINGWALGWRTDIEHEQTVGSVPANRLRRTRGGISLLPQWQGDRLKLTAGLRSEFFSSDSPAWLPQLGAEYILSDSLTAFASYTKTVRLPSYDELYDNAPGSLGDAALLPPTERQTEIGVKGVPSAWLDWKIAAFHRRSENTVDWMKLTPASRWTAMNIGTLDLYGTESQLSWYPAQPVELHLNYTWICKDRDAADFGETAARCALDYPEHQLKFTLLWHPSAAVEIGTVQSLRRQTENAVRTGGNFGGDSSWVVRFTPPQANYATVSLLLNHTWNDDFQTIPGQHPLEQFIGVSLRLSW